MQEFREMRGEFRELKELMAGTMDRRGFVHEFRDSIEAVDELTTTVGELSERVATIETEQKVEPAPQAWWAAITWPAVSAVAFIVLGVFAILQTFAGGTPDPSTVPIPLPNRSEHTQPEALPASKEEVLEGLRALILDIE